MTKAEYTFLSDWITYDQYVLINGVYQCPHQLTGIDAFINECTKAIKLSKMKDVCLCIIKEDKTIHSIGINNGEGKHYSKEGGGCFNLNNRKTKNLFEYKELTWVEFKEMLEN